jgi:hypothetical protein
VPAISGAMSQPTTPKDDDHDREQCERVDSQPIAGHDRGERAENHHIPTARSTTSRTPNDNESRC